MKTHYLEGYYNLRTPAFKPPKPEHSSELLGVLKYIKANHMKFDSGYPDPPRRYFEINFDVMTQIIETLEAAKGNDDG